MPSTTTDLAENTSEGQGLMILSYRLLSDDEYFRLVGADEKVTLSQEFS